MRQAAYGLIVATLALAGAVTGVALGLALAIATDRACEALRSQAPIDWEGVE